jgi:ubiquinone/menaquinone biosynthesis C-methylase UbiE
MGTPSPDFAKLKSGMKATWMAGDFGQIANYAAKASEDFVARTEIKPGARILDVACGTGNSAIPAARKGGSVIGVDIATNLLDQAKKRAAAENLPIQFDEGDAEDLPYNDGQFDIVQSMFGAMFAPRPDRVAAEFVRVCRPGGLIAMGNWTPEGFVGRSFRVTSELLPPPPGIPAPVLWGDEKTVHQRLSTGIASISMTRQILPMRFPFPPKEVVAFFREYFGPTKIAFSRLDEPGQAEFARRLEALWIENNQATDGTTSVDSEYLDVRAIRA